MSLKLKLNQTSSPVDNGHYGEKMFNNFENIIKYFKETEDKITKIYSLHTPYDSDFLSEQQNFGDGDLKISVIDQYRGKRPTLFNYEFVQTGKLKNFPVIPMVVLDSQVVTSLSMFVHDELSGNKKDTVRAFISYLIGKGWDYNPYFYFRESLAKSTPEKFYQHAVKSAYSILTLHSMDEDFFLRNNVIVPNEEAVSHYLSQYRCNTIQEAAEKQVLGYMQRQEHLDYLPLIRSIYCILVKVTLLHKSSNQGVRKKVSSLIDYIFLTLDAPYSFEREVYLSIKYILGKTKRFLNIEKNTDFEEAKKRLNSSAWDCFLLRQPEFMLAQGDEGTMEISYVCSQEEAIREMTSFYSVEEVIVSNPEDLLIPNTSIGCDMSDLKGDIDKETLDKITAHYGRHTNKKDDSKFLGRLDDLEKSINAELQGYLNG